jgi:hypothetical protein
MKMRFPYLCCGAALVGGALIAAEESVTDTYVATATVLPAGGASGGGPVFTAFCLPMVRPVVACGTISAVQEGTVTDAAANWSDDQFNAADKPHYIEFASGVRADIVDTRGTDGTLLLARNLERLVAPGAGYEVRPHQTIATVFGPNNEADLRSAPNPSQADTVLLIRGETQQIQSFFYSNAAAMPGWHSADYQPAGNEIIAPGQGFLVRRLRGQDGLLLLQGPVKIGPTEVLISEGINLVGILCPAGHTTLSELNLFSGSARSGIAASSFPAGGDNIVLYQADGTTMTYFYSDHPGFEGWHDSLGNPAGSAKIPAGSAFLIRRRAPNGPFLWTWPQP